VDNFFAFMCFGIILLVMVYAVFSMMRNRGASSGGAPYPTRGNEIPRYDDPNVSSGGSFGGQPSSGLGSSAPSASRGATLGESRPSHNDPNVKSGGSFGG
jgi:hypothetical protein